MEEPVQSTELQTTAIRCLGLTFLLLAFPWLPRNAPRRLLGGGMAVFCWAGDLEGWDAVWLTSQQHWLLPQPHPLRPSEEAFMGCRVNTVYP